MRLPAALLGALLVPALPLIAAAPASAATSTICVRMPAGTACSQSFTSLSAGIAAANTDGTDTALLIGPGTYSEAPYVFDGSSPLTVQGSGNGTGAGATIINVPGTGTPDVTVQGGGALFNLRIQVTGAGDVGLAMTGGSNAQKLIVADTPSGTSGTTGVRVSGSSLVDSTVNVVRGVGNTGILQVGGTATVSRVSVRASDTAVAVQDGSLGIDNSVLELENAGQIGLRAGTADSTGNVTVVARQLTIAGGAAGSRGVLAFSDQAGLSSTVGLTNSIVRGSTASLATSASAGSATVNVSNSDFQTQDVTAGGAVNPGLGNLDVDPGYVNAADGNYALRAGSPVVDKGDSVTVGPDRAGANRSFDGDGNGSPLPDMGAYELVDVVAPRTTYTSGPKGPTNDNTPIFQFKANDDGAKYECAVDSGAYVACVSPVTTTPLPDGAHTFLVRATDEALNVETPPATRSFTVDTVKPNAKITKKPGKRFYKQRVKFKFSANEPGVTFQCRLDNRPWQKCTSAYRFNVKRGWHVFQVRATDAAGNVDPKPAAYRFKRVKR